MKSLCDAGYTVLLETSGALDIAPVDPRVRRIMDLKCPSSGEVRRNRWQNLPLLKATDEIKFVIGTAQDYDWAREQLAARQLARICPVLFSWVSPLATASAGQIVEKSSRRPNRPHPAPTRRKNHRRRPARPLSTANAQIHLAPGPARASDMNRTQKILRLLRDYESPNILAIAPDLSAPMVWERARGVHVWDAAGRKYLDLTAAFGVAAAGHANPRVVAAGRRQMGVLLHAMGDVYPHARKAELARELSRLTFERWTAARPEESRLTGKTIFANSGFEAVEAALKTALLATGRPRILAFTGAYHGLGYGALNATHRGHFRAPFRAQLAGFGSVRALSQKQTPTCPAWKARCENCIAPLPSARFWSSRSRPAAASTFRPPVFCPGCANFATASAPCLYLTKFTPALAAPESGSPASTAPPCRT